MVSTSSLLQLIILSSYGTLRVALFLALWKDILIMFSAQRGLRTISLLPQLPGIALSAFGRCPVERKLECSKATPDTFSVLRGHPMAGRWLLPRQTKPSVS